MLKRLLTFLAVCCFLCADERSVHRNSSPSGAGQDELSQLGRKASLDVSHPQTDEESPPLQEGVLQIDLSQYDYSLYSQNGEDGVLSRIFQLIEPQSRFCVEFGASDGVTNSNTYLLRLQGWNSLLLDRMFEIPEMNLHKEFITAENINALFDKYGVPEDLDLLSIDIDYNDFYVWKALDRTKYRPTVVVIEYNGTHLPDQDKVVKYLPYFAGDGCNYFGASILALYNLGRSKGYSLVYAEKAGVNLFFIRDDVLAEKKLSFKDMNKIEKLYRRPTYGKGPNGGHRTDPKNRAYASSADLLK